MIGAASTKLGVVLVVAGALLMAGPIFGFTTLAADRGVNVGTADDPNALLGIEATGETPDNQNDAVVINITNNANERFDPLDAQAEITADPNGALAISDGFDTTLDPGATTGLQLTCSGGGSGTATVEVTADASSSSLSIQGVTYSHTFSYSCTGGGGGGPPGFTSVSAGNISGSGPTTQELTFALDGKLQKGETVTIDISSVIANYDGGRIDTFTVGGKRANHDISFQPAGDTATITVAPRGTIKGGQEVRIVLDGVTPEYEWFGLATFSTGSDQLTDYFDINSGSASTSANDLPDGDGTITREELESVPIEELRQFDTYDEFEAYLESETDIEVVEDDG